MILFFAIILILKILDFIYLFQIKEYRLDRFIAALHDMGIRHMLYSRNPRIPSKSIRNLLIAGVSFILAGASFLYIYTHPLTALTQSLLLIISPLVALSYTWAGVLTTWPLAYTKRKALIQKAKARIMTSETVRIGVSGSYGKSSVKEMLYHILASRFETAKTDKNMNTPVGVAISILNNLKDTTKYFIAEVGGYKRGEVLDASRVFSPQHAILTPFGNQHLALYGSRDSLIMTESEILDLIPQKGIIYIPYESQTHLAHINRPLKTYSLHHKEATIYADKIQTTEKGTKAVVHLGKSHFAIATHLLGGHTIQNLLPCIGLALDLGMKTNDVKKAVLNMKQIKGKLSSHAGHNGAAILDDTGNSSLDGFLVAIEILGLFKEPKKLIISKGVIELGSEKKSSYKTIIDHIDKYNMQLYTDDNLFKKYDQSNNVIIRYNDRDLLNAIKSRLDKDTVVLLEGRFQPDFIHNFLN